MTALPCARAPRRTALLPALVAALLPLGAAGCSLGAPPPSAVGPATAAPVGLAPWQVPAPGALTRGRLPADLLVWTDRPLTERLQRRVTGTRGVRASTRIAIASVPVEGRTLVVAGVDPATFRRFTDDATAASTALWQRVASGDIALTRDAATSVHVDLGGTLVLQGRSLRVGALAGTVPTVDAVVNLPRAEQLGLRANGLVLAVRGSVDRARDRVERRVPGATARILTTAGGTPVYSGRLVGGSLADAVGSFTYRWFADGSVAPDPAWVAANIRTEQVPILGAVTCHRVVFPQLRAALREIERRGLADRIHPDEYGGCYHPRFIGSDPGRGLSLHTFGIALDLNVPGNLRGTTGEIDRQVVAIFQRWGFAWGGDWSYTDPMHFELAVLLRPAGG